MISALVRFVWNVFGMIRMSTLNVILATLLILGLWLPLLQHVTQYFPEEPLYGYTPPQTSSPSDMTAWFDRRFQKWSEAYVNSNIGFRTVLVRTYNETVFRLFHSLPHMGVVNVPPGELVFYVHVMALNNTVLKKDELEKDYELRARHMYLAQKELARSGTYFLRVIAPSRGGSYPDQVPRRFLVRNSKIILREGVHYGDFLVRGGVNVLDLTKEFQKLRRKSSIRMDAPYGVHWNFYAGCLAAQEVIEKLHALSGDTLNGITCKPVVYKIAHSTDIDELVLLNLWHPSRYFSLMPYPTIKAISLPHAVKPSVLVIGDSYSDQFRVAFSRARIFKEVDFASYFSTLRQVGINDEMNAPPAVPINRTTFTLAPGGKPYRFVILESVDYQLDSYKEYGFINSILKSNLPTPNPLIIVNAWKKSGHQSPMLISGWGHQSRAGTRITSWPAVLAFQTPHRARRLRLLLWLRSLDGPVSFHVSIDGKDLPIQLISHKSGFASGMSSDAMKHDIIISVDLPCRIIKKDRFPTVTLSPETKRSNHSVLLRRLELGVLNTTSMGLPNVKTENCPKPQSRDRTGVK